MLVYNPTDAKVKYTVPAECTAFSIAGTNNRTVSKKHLKGKIALPAYGLALVQ